MEHNGVYQYSSQGFFSRSFTTAFSGKNLWFFLLACAILLIPIIGPLWSLGYFIRRGQKIAWGIKAEPTSEDLQFVPCIKVGFATFLIYLVAGIILVILSKIFYNIPVISTIWTFLRPLVAIVLLTVCNVFALHYAIYDDISAIFTKRPFTEIKEMKSSFITMNIAVFFIELIFGVLNIILLASAFTKFGFDTLTLLDTSSIESRIPSIIYYIIANLGTLFILLLAVMTSSLAIRVCSINATSLWLMGSNVAEWGSYDDENLPRLLNDGESPRLNVVREEVVEKGEMDDDTISSVKEEKIETIESPGAEIVVEEKKDSPNEDSEQSDK